VSLPKNVLEAEILAALASFSSELIFTHVAGFAKRFAFGMVCGLYHNEGKSEH
jgi:hypothetical protein